MSWILGTVGFVLVIIWALTLFDLWRSGAARQKKFAWTIIVLLLPFVGSIAYWIMRPASSAEIDERLGAQADLRRGGPHDRASHPPSMY
jgi:hypothetical protein